jgi:hypothetical protein
MLASRLSRAWLLVAIVLSLLVSACGGTARASSGQIGCPANEIEISDKSVSVGTTTWTATCRGRVFYCSSATTGDKTSQYQCTEAMDSSPSPSSAEPATATASSASVAETSPAASPPDAGPKPFPKEALGFTFGSPPEAAQEACLSQGHEWTGEAPNFACSGAGVKVGVPVETKLVYCNGKLCELRAFTTLTPDDAGQQQFIKLRKSLQKQYGEPEEDETKVPQACQKTFMTCLVDGRASWESTWEWDSGAVIRAKAGSSGQAPVIGILYRRVTKSGARKAEAAESLDADVF